jgi:hypothetical protein
MGLVCYTDYRGFRSGISNNRDSTPSEGLPTGQKTSRLSLLEEDQRWRVVSWSTSGQTDSMQEIAEAGLRAKGVGHRLHPIVD